VSGCHQYRVNTQGDCRCDCRADDRLVYLLYYPPPDGEAPCIKERCVDNAVGLDGQWRCRCALQPEMKSKVDVLGGPPATMAVSAVQVEHRLNLARRLLITCSVAAMVVASSDRRRPV